MNTTFQGQPFPVDEPAFDRAVAAVLTATAPTEPQTPEAAEARLALVTAQITAINESIEDMRAAAHAGVVRTEHVIHRQRRANRARNILRDEARLLTNYLGRQRFLEREQAERNASSEAVAARRALAEKAIAALAPPTLEPPQTVAEARARLKELGKRMVAIDEQFGACRHSNEGRKALHKAREALAREQAQLRVALERLRRTDPQGLSDAKFKKAANQLLRRSLWVVAQLREQGIAENDASRAYEVEVRAFYAERRTQRGEDEGT